MISVIIPLYNAEKTILAASYFGFLPIFLRWKEGFSGI